MSDKKEEPGSEEERKLNDSFSAVNEASKGAIKFLDNVLKSLVPEKTTRNVKLVISPEKKLVIRKGFLGIGRKEQIIPAVAVDANIYISMNNVLVMDISDKAKMREYYDSL